jgi:hypothetical protein
MQNTPRSRVATVVRLTTSDTVPGPGGDVYYVREGVAVPGTVYTFYNETGADGVIPGVIGTKVVVAFLYPIGGGNYVSIDPPGIVQVHDGTSGTTNYVILTAPPNAQLYEIGRTSIL